MKFRKVPTGVIIALTTVGILLAIATAAVLSANQNIPLNGTVSTINVVNLGVYSDSACIQTATALNVGTLSPGGTGTQTVYIKNTGNVPETLTMTTNTWAPSNASTYLTLTWNQQNTILPAGQSIQATLTLTAASNCGSMTNFSCNVTIIGTQ